MTRQVVRAAITAAGALCLAGIWFALSQQRLAAPHAGGHAAGHAGAMAWSVALFAVPGLLAMFPCLMQMSIALVAVVTALPQAQKRQQRAARWTQFLAGYVGIYALVGAGIGLFAETAPQWLPQFRVVGGVLLALLGVWLAGLVAGRPARRCRGPIGLFLRLPPGGQPAAAGAAFAVYCSGCCAPYMYGAALLAGALGSVWHSTSVAVLFALGTAVPLALPALSAGVAGRMARGIAPLAPRLARVSGFILMLLGILITVEGTLLAALAAVPGD